MYVCASFPTFRHIVHLLVCLLVCVCFPTCVTVCLLSCLPVCLTVHLSVCRCVCLCVFLTASFFACFPTCLTAKLLSSYLYVFLPTFSSIGQSVCGFVFLSLCPYVCLTCKSPPLPQDMTNPIPSTPMMPPIPNKERQREVFP